MHLSSLPLPPNIGGVVKLEAMRWRSVESTTLPPSLQSMSDIGSPVSYRTNWITATIDLDGASAGIETFQPHSRRA